MEERERERESDHYWLEICTFKYVVDVYSAFLLRSTTKGATDTGKDPSATNL